MLMVMRPYQITATERIFEPYPRLQTTTKSMGESRAVVTYGIQQGSRKTVTSFKTARLASQLPYIDKVLFVVDRKDLDYQTMKEYDRFEKGAANSNTSTAILKRQLENDAAHIIITTIQSWLLLSRKIRGMKFTKTCCRYFLMNAIAASSVICIRRLSKTLRSIPLFGFTGTPIFCKEYGCSNRSALFYNWQTLATSCIPTPL